MSLLNLASDGHRSVLVSIYRLVVAEKSVDRERLVTLCAPADLAEPRHARSTLNTWVELGLFEKSEQDKISVNPRVPVRERRDEFLGRLARTRVLASENNERFWQAENSRTADFTRATAWILAQDVYESEFSTWESVQVVIQKQAPESELFGQNNTRWNGLKAWTPFLGFSWMGKHPTTARSNVLMIDPTVAVSETLPDIFGKHRTLSADELLAGLAEKLPVLDGGRYRQMVEEKLNEREGATAWVPPPKGQVSTSLSRALLRLVGNRTLKAEKRADAPERARLTGRNRAVAAEYSHFSFRPTVAAE